MNYMIKSGMLYRIENNRPASVLLSIRSRLNGMKKEILLPDGTAILNTDVASDIENDRAIQEGGHERYIGTDLQGQIYASGTPNYASGEDACVAGWPMTRLPRVDTVDITIADRHCRLTMLNNQNYRLTAADGSIILEVIHRGIDGGWNLETAADSGLDDPKFLGVIFIFCRYLERENEFICV